MTFPYNAQLDAFTIYHQIQEEEEQNHTPHKLPSTFLGPALGHAISGSTGAAISHLLIYPLDLVITRLQVQRQLREQAELDNAADHSSYRSDEKRESGESGSTTLVGSEHPDNDDDDAEYKSVLDAIQKIYTREGGLLAFYSGVLPSTTKSVVDSFLFFLAYNFVRQRRLRHHQQHRGGSNAKTLPVLEELGVGMLSGAFSKLWTTPIQNIVTRTQTASMRARPRSSSTTNTRLARPNTSIPSIAAQIQKEKGLLGFWSGYSASLVLTLNPSLTFLLHHALVRALVPRARRDNPGGRTTFLIAALSKAIASSVTYPFSLVKARAQASSSSSSSAPSASSTPPAADASNMLLSKLTQLWKTTIFHALLVIARKEGLAALYHGVGGEVAKGFFTHGVTMLIKERIHVEVVQLYYFVAGLVARQKGKARETVEATTGAVVDATKGTVDAAKGAVDAAKGAVDAVKGQAGAVKEQVGAVKGQADAVMESVKESVTKSVQSSIEKGTKTE